jgi:hypothetical protein
MNSNVSQASVGPDRLTSYHHWSQITFHTKSCVRQISLAPFVHRGHRLRVSSARVFALSPAEKPSPRAEEQGAAIGTKAVTERQSDAEMIASPDGADCRGHETLQLRFPHG